MDRKIDVGQVVERVFAIYRDQAAVLLPVAAAVFLVEAIASGLLIAISAILVLVAIVVQLVISTLYQGMVVSLVSDVQDGRRDHSVGELFRSVTPVLLPLIIAGLLAGLGIALGLLLLIVPGLFLLTIWAVIAPVIVVERRGVFEAFGRSRELVRGNGWPVFGVIVIFVLILLVVSFVLGVIGALIGDAGQLVAEFLASVITAPLVALAASVLYFRLTAAKGESPGLAGAPGHDAVGAGQPGAPSGPAGAERERAPAPQSPPPGPEAPPAQGPTDPPR